MEKICRWCLKSKDISLFAKNKRNKDGRLNICKECRNKKFTEQYNTDNDYKQAHKNYNNGRYIKTKTSPALSSYQHNTLYKTRHPEKHRAQLATKGFDRPIGMQLHHWNYNEDYKKDVVIITPENHRKLHRATKYIPGLMVYKVKVSGEILDSKEKTIQFINKLIINQK